MIVVDPVFGRTSARMCFFALRGMCPHANHTWMCMTMCALQERQYGCVHSEEVDAVAQCRGDSTASTCERCTT